MNMYTDNIMPKTLWTPVYYFLVLRTTKYDKANTLPVIRHIGPAPELAYAYYLDDVNFDSGTVRQHVYDYSIQDSFGKDALKFCEDSYSEYLKNSPVKEKIMTE